MRATLSTIRHKLMAVRSAVRALYLVDGLLRLLAAAVLLLVAGFLLDRLIEFPRPLRVGMLALQLGLFGAGLARWLLYPLRVRISVEDIAGQVELRNPFLKDRLISALQLERLLRDPEYADSRPLTEAVIREAEELAGGIRFFKILHPRPVLVTALVALLISGSASGACVVWSRQAKVWALRNLLLADVEWPRENQIHLIRRTFRVTSGRPLAVRFLLDELPRTDTPIELRVLELAGGGEAKQKPARPLDALRAVRSASVPELAAREPQTLYYHEQSIPLRQVKLEQGIALEATLPPAQRSRLFFLRADRVKSAPFFSLRFEQVLSPFYEVLPVRSGDPEQTAVVPLPDRAIYVPLGHNLKLEAVVFGPIRRDRTTIEYQVEEGRPQSDLLLGIEHGNRFAYEDFIEVRRELAFRLASGDQPAAHGPTYQVRVRIPPAVAGHRFDLRYPSYLGRQPAPGLQGKRDFLETPLGTVFGVQVTAEFSRPAPEKGKQPPAVPYAAWLRFSQGRQGEIALRQAGPPEPVPGSETRVQVLFEGSFQATHDTGFFFRLRGPNRLENENARHFQVGVQPDAPPVLSLDRPKTAGSPEYLATRNAAVRVVLRAADDRGLGRVALRYRLDGETSYREQVLKAAAHPFQVKYPPGKAPVGEPTARSFRFPWELEKIGGLKERMRIHYHFLAEDYAPFALSEDGRLVARKYGNRTWLRAGGADQQLRSDRPDFVIRIVSKIEMEQELNTRLMMLRQEVRRMARLQRDLRKTAEGYSANQQYSAGDLDQLFRLELRQNDLSRITADQIRAPLIEIRELYAENHLSPGTRVGEMVRLSSAIVRELSPAAAQLLKAAQATSDAPFQRKSLVAAVKKQDEILKHLDDMLQEMQKWEDLSEVIQQAQELLKYQNEINTLTRTLKRR